MVKRYNRQARATKQAIEMAVAVPQVIAHRTLRMAQAGSSPSARDRREFWTMGFEKAVAFNQSWFEMFAEAGRIQQRMALSMMQAFWFPWLNAMPTLSAMQGRWRNAAFDVAAKGVGPIHRTAVANARRLAGRR